MKGIKFYKIIVFLVLFVFVRSCKKDRRLISSELFNTDNLSVKINSVDDLNDQGFNAEEGNISILQKKNKDTIIQLEIDFKYNDLSSKIWKIKFDSTDRTKVEDFLLKYNIHLLGPTGYFNDSGYQVPAINFKNNKVFICTVGKEGDDIYISIKYYVPR